MEGERGDSFKVKWTKFLGHKVPFLLQKTDGECPLICLSNVLLLRRELELPKGCQSISFSSLSSFISSMLPEYSPEWVGRGHAQVVQVLRSLNDGLLFNCKFDSTEGMVPSDPHQIFTSFKIPIKHGWIADPAKYAPIAKLNYDELLEKLAVYQSRGGEQAQSDSELANELEKLKIDKRSQDTGAAQEMAGGTDGDADGGEDGETQGPRGESCAVDGGDAAEKAEHAVFDIRDKEAKAEAGKLTGELALSLTAEDFLDRYATQLTEYGANTLRAEIGDGELVALYRNNHFLVATKRFGQLFTLVTDEVFYEHKCIWELLETGEYFNENFMPYVHKGDDKPKKKMNFIEKCKRVFKIKKKKRPT